MGSAVRCRSPIFPATVRQSCPWDARPERLTARLELLRTYAHQSSCSIVLLSSRQMQPARSVSQATVRHPQAASGGPPASGQQLSRVAAASSVIGPPASSNWLCTRRSHHQRLFASPGIPAWPSLAPSDDGSRLHVAISQPESQRAYDGTTVEWGRRCRDRENTQSNSPA